ncbi:MAG: hypothetical protein LBO79_01875 [Zoogloeaceae bacterium]|jgi:ABC-type transporter Mla MlaB component|nr:hypothetical protein [Zoogloeaceae bacterium]
MVLSFFRKPEKMPERAAVRPDGARVQPVRENETAHATANSTQQAPVEEELDSTFYSGGSYGIEIQEETNVYSDMAEHAAMSFAAGQDDMARSTLQSMVKGNNDPAALRLWAMLFDLLRLQGDHDAFNTLCLEFAQTCELSPPSWGETQNKTQEAAEENDHEHVMIQGTLVGDAPLFNDLLQAMSQGETRHLNFGRLASLDGEAAAKLAKLLNQARKRKLAWELEGAEGLTTRLVKRTLAGQRQNEPLWLLLLELYQYLGKESEFEEKALDYAITFEVSPPAWEQAHSPIPKVKTTSAPNASRIAKPPPPVLQGEILEGKLDAVKALLKPGQECSVDFSLVSRMDFVSATSLSNLIRTSGCSAVTLYHPNRLVAEILRMAGTDRVAKVELSKY